MSPTWLEIITGVLAAVCVFLFALRIVPPIIKEFIAYIERTLNGDTTDDEEPQHHDH